MTRENLWAPWRLTYLRELDRKTRAALAGVPEAAGPPDASATFLSDYWNRPESDHDTHVIHRNEHGMVLLNRYPYANGHLLVALGEPRPRLLAYTAAQRAEFWKLVEVALALIETALHPQGVNVGLNEGAAAGAGVPEHLHAHLVPRWAGDTNFITVVGQVRVVPQALEEVAAMYRDALPEVLGSVGG